MLSPTVQASIAQQFSPADQSRVTDALSQYGGREAERVHTVILRLAKGDPNEVVALVATAKVDYRDVLMRERSKKEKMMAYLFVAAVVVFVLVWRAHALFA